MISLLHRPDSYTVTTDDANTKDVALRFENTPSGLDFFVSAQTSHIKFITLRWRCPIRVEVSVLCDAWERSYGNLGFSALDPERALPWYFALRHQNGTDCIGVGVQPNAFVHFTVNCEGITAYCDLRAGTVGVDLA